MHLKFPVTPEKLTPAEQKLLEYIEGNREEFLFMTIGQLAAKLEVSEATISRFARHLGCQDFKQLKNIVVEQNHLEGPAGTQTFRSILQTFLIGPFCRRPLFHCLKPLLHSASPVSPGANQKAGLVKYFNI